MIRLSKPQDPYATATIVAFRGSEPFTQVCMRAIVLALAHVPQVTLPIRQQNGYRTATTLSADFMGLVCRRIGLWTSTSF